MKPFVARGAAVPGLPCNFDSTQEFHRRIAAIIETVQKGIWERGVHDLLGHATDFGFGQGYGVQTLVLKTPRKSAYLRLNLDTILSEGPLERQQVVEATQRAVTELA